MASTLAAKPTPPPVVPGLAALSFAHYDAQARAVAQLVALSRLVGATRSGRSRALPFCSAPSALRSGQAAARPALGEPSRICGKHGRKQLLSGSQVASAGLSLCSVDHGRVWLCLFGRVGVTLPRTRTLGTRAPTTWLACTAWLPASRYLGPRSSRGRHVALVWAAVGRAFATR